MDIKKRVLLLLISPITLLVACNGYSDASTTSQIAQTEQSATTNTAPKIKIEKNKSEIIDHKVIDQNGSGVYNAIAATEASLKNFVVYRPENLAAAAQSENTLPIMVFANGGCNNTSIPHERLLSEVASHGYLIVALGALQRELSDRKLNKAPNAMIIEAIDWLTAKNNEPSSEYFQTLDLNKVAIGGQSCGGAQVLAVAADPRIKTYMMFNSGIGDMTMAKAQRESLKNLHGPVLYLVGGESDVATTNAELDYSRINHVPIAFSNLLNGGHGGTFEQKFGGSFATMTIKWLNWQLKGQPEHSDIFLQQTLTEFPGWTMKSKQF